MVSIFVFYLPPCGRQFAAVSMNQCVSGEQRERRVEMTESLTFFPRFMNVCVCVFSVDVQFVFSPHTQDKL